MFRDRHEDDWRGDTNGKNWKNVLEKWGRKKKKKTERFNILQTFGGKMMAASSLSTQNYINNSKGHAGQMRIAWRNLLKKVRNSS